MSQTIYNQKRSRNNDKEEEIEEGKENREVKESLE